METGSLDDPVGEPTRLSRRLGTGDAIVVGLGSMLGAGVFVAVAPASRAAGSALLLGLAVAAAVAYANATSSAQLAAVHPVSGGTYAYGRRQLGRLWGVMAGWAFVVGKVASCATIALAFGRYVWPEGERILAVAAVLAFTAVNYRGVGKTVAVTRFLVAGVLIALAAAVVGALGGGTADPARLTPFWPANGLTGVLQAAALLFYAFAGYARVATLGEEVVEPARTIPRAIPMALLIALVVYAAVALAVLLAVGPEAVSAAEAPVAEAVEEGDLSVLGPIVRAGAVLATLGVLLSLLAGVARTTFAMAADGELPRALSAVHPRFRVPHRAELVIGIVVASLAAVASLTEALALSSFTVLLYYAITNAAALTLRPEQRRWPPSVATFGLLGCGVLALSLPVRTLAVGAGLLLVAAAGHGLRNAALRRRSL